MSMSWKTVQGMVLYVHVHFHENTNPQRSSHHSRLGEYQTLVYLRALCIARLDNGIYETLGM